MDYFGLHGECVDCFGLVGDIWLMVFLHTEAVSNVEGMRQFCRYNHIRTQTPLLVMDDNLILFATQLVKFQNVMERGLLR